MVTWHIKAMRICQLRLRFVIMMTSSNGNIFRVTDSLCGEFTGQRPVTRSFDIFFDLHLNKRLRLTISDGIAPIITPLLCKEYYLHRQILFAPISWRVLVNLELRVSQFHPKALIPHLFIKCNKESYINSTQERRFSQSILNVELVNNKQYILKSLCK